MLPFAHGGLWLRGCRLLCWRGGTAPEPLGAGPWACRREARPSPAMASPGPLRCTLSHGWQKLHPVRHLTHHFLPSNFVAVFLLETVSLPCTRHALYIFIAPEKAIIELCARPQCWRPRPGRPPSVPSLVQDLRCHVPSLCLYKSPHTTQPHGFNLSFLS